MDAPHAPVPVQDPLLEEGCQECQYRHNDCDNQCQTPVKQEHDHKNTNDIHALPEQIDQHPGDQCGNLIRIINHSRKDITHRSCIVIGKRKFLQVYKKRAFHISSRAHLQLHTAIAEKDNQERLHRNHSEIKKNHLPDTFCCLLRNVCVDRITLK